MLTGLDPRKFSRVHVRAGRLRSSDPKRRLFALRQVAELLDSAHPLPTADGPWKEPLRWAVERWCGDATAEQQDAIANELLTLIDSSREPPQ